MSSPTPYAALRHHVARVSRTDRGVVRLRGADRAVWLQGLVTNDVLGLAPGRRVYAAWLTPQGRMLTDLWAVATPEAILLDVPAGLAADLAGRLDGLIFAEDVQIDDVSAGVAVTDIVGVPGEGGISASGLVVPDTTYGRPGLVVYGPFEAVTLEQGRAELADAPMVSLGALEVLRIEAGVPRFLVDMATDTIPLEAGLEDRAISFTKGCYVGQEIIVRVTTRGGGRVARRLVGLVLDEVAQLAADEWSGQSSSRAGDAAGIPMAPAGYPVQAGDRAIGQVTSLTRSPLLDRWIALATVHRDFTEPGTSVTVALPGGLARASVHALPFVGGEHPAHPETP